MNEHWPTLLMIVAAAVAALVMLTFAPALVIKMIQRKALEHRCRGALCLTYDDGPGLAMTPALVDLLHRHHAKATFFLVGFRAQRAPAMADLLRDAGNEIGCHTQMHRNAWRDWPWSSIRDVGCGLKTLSPWMSLPRLFRPPFGNLTLWIWLAAKAHGARQCWWTIDGGDTHDALPDPASIARRLIDAGGGVILLHSHDRGEQRQHYVLAVTQHLLEAASEHGFQVCTMSELPAAQRARNQKSEVRDQRSEIKAQAPALRNQVLTADLRPLISGSTPAEREGHVRQA